MKHVKVRGTKGTASVTGKNTGRDSFFPMHMDISNKKRHPFPTNFGAWNCGGDDPADRKRHPYVRLHWKRPIEVTSHKITDCAGYVSNLISNTRKIDPKTNKTDAKATLEIRMELIKEYNLPPFYILPSSGAIYHRVIGSDGAVEYKEWKNQLIKQLPYEDKKVSLEFALKYLNIPKEQLLDLAKTGRVSMSGNYWFRLRELDSIKRMGINRTVSFCA